MVALQILDLSSDDDFRNLRVLYPGFSLLGISQGDTDLFNFFEKVDLINYLNFAFTGDDEKIALFEIPGMDEKKPGIYFADQRGEIFTQIFESDELDVDHVISFLTAIKASEAAGQSGEEAMSEQSAWRIFGASTSSPVIGDQNYGLLFSCRGEIASVVAPEEYDGQNWEFLTAVLQFWISIRERKFAICAIEDGREFDARWKTFDIDDLQFESKSHASGLVKIRITSEILESTGTIHLPVDDSLAVIEILSNPLKILQKAADLSIAWEIVPSYDHEIQQILRIGAASVQVAIRRDEIWRATNDDRISAEEAGKQSLELIDLGFSWGNFLESFDLEKLHFPGAVNSISKRVEDIRAELETLEDLMRNEIELFESNEQVLTQDEQIDPFGDIYWFKASDSVFVRPFKVDDPISGFIAELPYVNQQGRSSGRFVDWSNSATLDLSENVSASVYSLAQQIAQLNLQAVPPLELNSDMSIAVTGYAQSGLLKTRRILNAVQIMARLSRHFRKSANLFCVSVRVEQKIALVFVSGELYRGMRADYARSAQANQEMKRFADYQANAIRRELNREY